jgi:hypothetical protein
MKVSGPGSTQSSGSVRRARRGGEGESAKFADQIRGEESVASAGVSASTPLTPLDALLAVQEAGTSTQGRSRGLSRGTRMLDLLDDVRHGLLRGAIPVSKLESLLTAVKGQRDHVDDPRLGEILDEIELRAAVELAKLERMP